MSDLDFSDLPEPGFLERGEIFDDLPAPGFLKDNSLPGREPVNTSSSFQEVPEDSLFNSVGQQLKAKSDQNLRDSFTVAEIGAEVGGALKGGAWGLALGGPLGGVAGAIAGGTLAGKVVDEIAQKLGIREDVSVAEDVTDFGSRLLFNTLMPGGLQVASTVVKAGKALKTGASNLRKTLKHSAQSDAWRVANESGGILNSLAVTKGSGATKVYSKLLGAEDFIKNSEVLSGGSKFNPHTMKFEGARPLGAPAVTLSDIRDAVKGQVHGNPNAGVISLMEQRKVLISQAEEAFSSFNKANKSNPIRSPLTEDWFKGASKEAKDAATSLSKLKGEFGTEGASEVIDTIVKDVNRSIQLSADKGPQHISDLIFDIGESLKSLQAFDVAKQAAVAQGVKPSAMSGSGAAIKTLTQYRQALQQARSDLIDDIAVKASGRVSSTQLSGKLIDNLDDSYQYLKRLDEAFGYYFQQRQTRMFDLSASGRGVQGGGAIIGGRTGALIDQGVRMAEEPLQSAGVFKSQPARVLAQEDRMLQHMQDAASLRGTPPPGSPNLTPPPPVFEAPSVSGLASTMGTISTARGLMSQEKGASEVQAQIIAEATAMSQVNEENSKRISLENASKRFGFDLSVFPSTQVMDDKVFVDDPADQQQLIAILREDKSIPKSYLWKQISRFNNPTLENELTPIPKAKKKGLAQNDRVRLKTTKGRNPDYKY